MNIEIDISDADDLNISFRHIPQKSDGPIPIKDMQGKAVWVCTNPDSCQYIKNIGDRRYLCVEAVWLDLCREDEGYPDKDYTVKSALVDLNDYSDEEIEAAVAPFYGSVKGMLESYYPDCEAYKDDLIVECVFEEMNDGSAATSGMMTREEAEEYIEEYILNH